MFDIMRIRKAAACLALLSGLDILVWREVIHDHGNPSRIKDLLETVFFKLFDGNRRCDVIA